jgi:murein DD-endopeptidase
MYLPKPYKGNFKITSPFDPKRLHPVTKEIKPHNGIDIGMPAGTKLWSPIECKATVYNQTTKDGKLTGYGHYIVLTGKTSSNTEVLFLFGHLLAADIENGSHVMAGTIIGRSGNSGTSTGDHLHFECRIWDKEKKDYVAVDPERYFYFGDDENIAGQTFFA